MKRTVALLLTLILLSSFSVNGLAFALREPRVFDSVSLKGKDDVYFEDFTSCEEGGLPKGMKITQTDTNKIEVVEYPTPDKEKKNVLKFTDTSTSGAGYITIPVPQSENPITMEMRIKHIKTTQPGYGFIMNFMDDEGTNAFRIIRFNSDNAPYTYISYSGNDKNFTSSNNNNINHNDSWFTIKVRIDSQLKQTGVIIENDQIVSATTLNSAKYPNIYPDPENKKVMGYKLPWLSEQIEGVTQIQMMTYSGSTGEHYIDYIKFTENVPEIMPIRKRAESKDAEVIADPGPGLYNGIINMVFRNEIIYMRNPIIIENSRAMAEAVQFGELYGLELEENNGAYKLKGENISLDFAENTSDFSLNGASYKADISPLKKNGVLYIPVKSFANALGSNVKWSAAPDCVTIE